MISAFVVSVALQWLWHFDTDKPEDFAWLMIITVAITTGVWLTVTLLTKPESQETLLAFYRRTRPSAAGWGPIARLAPEIQPVRDGLRNLLDWAGGCMLIYGALFGTGKLLLKEFGPGLALLSMGARGFGDHLSRSFEERLACGGGLDWLRSGCCPPGQPPLDRWTSAWPN